MKYIILPLLLLAFVSCKDNVSGEASSNVTGGTTTVTDCTVNDGTAPILNGSITLSNDATVFNSPTINFNAATEACSFSHYEVAIGTSAGAENVLSFTQIGSTTSHQQTGLNLSYNQVYYVSLRAIDTAGNRSALLTSNSFQVFTPQTLTSLVVWLDASQLSSIEDAEGDDANSTNFSNDVDRWRDLSGSTAIHDFTKDGPSFPNFDVTARGIRFNGSQEFFASADHPDINTSVIGQRNLTVTFKTSDNISSRQVIFEEGGTVRGLNIYIEDDRVRCGFWNDRNDGDGQQPYVEVTSVIEENKLYNVTLLFDYSHFTGANSANGTIECIVNGVNEGSVDTTSRLHAHSGDIGLGGMNNDAYFHDGPASSDGFFFDGVIFELLLYNSAHSVSDIQNLHSILQTKWENAGS